MIKYWIWLGSVCSASVRMKLKMLSRCGSPKDVFFCAETDINEMDWLPNHEKSAFLSKDLSKAYEILQQCGEKNIEIITIQDAKYPERLRNIENPPLVLYIKGNLPAVDEEAAIGIVGTRKATPYGLKSAQRLGYELARAGALVVSGLAAGIDSSAAIGAIKAGKPVIGVLGCNIDDIYPKYNGNLYEDVKQTGALVSEYPPGYPINGRNFPERNRIISGLSVGVAVIEAPARSGALITASLALEQGRELFVVPGNVDSSTSMGSNRLLSESAAKVVTNASDILVEFEGLFPWKLKTDRIPDSRYLGDTDAEKNSKTDAKSVKNSQAISKKVIDKAKNKSYIDLREQLEGLSEDELKLISHITKLPKHIDDIIESSGMPVSNALSAMTMLQLKGHVAEHNGKRFSLIIIKK